MPEARVCPACGRSADASAVFCAACGRRLPTAVEEPPTVERALLDDSPAEPPTIELAEAPAKPDELGAFPPTADIPPVAPPPSPLAAREDRWGRILAALGSVAITGAVIFVVMSIRYRRLLFPAAAWAFALVPIGYAIYRALRERKAGGRGRALFAGAFAAVILTATTVLVARSCEPQLGPRANLAGCDFSNKDLSGLDLRGANLIGAKLVGTDLTGANLERAKLAKSDLGGASLVDANVRNAVLDDVVLTRTLIDDAAFDGAHMANVVFTDAAPQGVAFRGATLTGADLSRSTLDRIDLSEAVLDDANLFNASLVSANLSRASLIAAKLEGTKLLDANLTGADLTRAELTATDLNRAQLNGADLTEAKLTDLKLGGAVLIGVRGLPDEKLAAALEVGVPALAETLSGQEIRLEERDAILAAFESVCTGRAPVAQAAPHRGGGLNPIVLLTADGKPSLDFGEDAAGLHWEPMAVRFGQLVACVGEERQVSIQICRYRTDSGKAAEPITRYEHRRKLRVVEARTAKVVVDKTVVGTPPDFCPLRTNLPNTRIDGGDVTFADLEAVLAPLVT